MKTTGLSSIFLIFICIQCTVAELECRSEDPNCIPAILPVILIGGCSQSSGQLISLAAEDGTVTESPLTASTSGGIVNIGDLADATVIQLFLSFDISALQGGLMSSATVSIYQGSSNGTPSNITPFFVDHLDFGTLDTSDFGTSALTQGFHQITNVANASFKTFDVSPFLQADLLAGRTRSQYRIRATSNADASADFIGISTGDSGTNPPALDYTVCF